MELTNKIPVQTIYVAFGYKARHGKGTAVQAIIDKFGGQYDIREYQFSHELKKEVSAMNQFEVCWRNGIKYDTEPDMTDPRCQGKDGKQPALLQFWGQKRREEDPFYWINKLRAQIAEDQPQVALVSDMRQFNELLWIKANKGYTVKVSRQGFIDLSRDPNHLTEVQLDRVEFDFDINVLEGELEELKRDACEVFQMILDAQNPGAEAIAA